MKISPCAIVLALPTLALMIWQSTLWIERAGGNDVEVAISGYDPRDLLLRHYLNYRIDWEKTDCTQFQEGHCLRADFCDPCRFYLPEKDAKMLHKRLAHANQQHQFTLIYRYRPNRFSFAKTLLLNG